MPTKNYTRTVDGDKLTLRMNLAEASAPILFRWNDEGPRGTGDDDDREPGNNAHHAGFTPTAP